MCIFCVCVYAWVYIYIVCVLNTERAYHAKVRGQIVRVGLSDLVGFRD